jgi:hypothetical protein
MRKHQVVPDEEPHVKLDIGTSLMGQQCVPLARTPRPESAPSQSSALLITVILQNAPSFINKLFLIHSGKVPHTRMTYAFVVL